MNTRRKGKRGYIIVAVLVAMIVTLSIAYAAMSTTLKINYGNVVLSKQTWNVGFEPNSALSPTVLGTSNTGRSCGTATVTATTVTVANTSISKPGDYCIWALKIKNQGSINANLKTITPTQPTGTGVECSSVNGSQMVCGHITYKIATASDGAGKLETGTVINGGGEKTVYLLVRYNSDELASSQIVQSGAKFSLIFEQK